MSEIREDVKKIRENGEITDKQFQYIIREIGYWSEESRKLNRAEWVRLVLGGLIGLLGTGINLTIVAGIWMKISLSLPMAVPLIIEFSKWALPG